jgi:hypothetical protein
LDTKLCTYHVRRFTEHRPKRIWPFPYHAVVALAAAPRLVLAQHRDKLCMWQLPAAAPAQAAPAGGGDVGNAATAGAVVAAGAAAGSSGGGHRLLLEVTLKAASALVCSAVAPDGLWLAVSDTQRLRVFRVHGAAATAAASADALLSSGDVRLVPVPLPGTCGAPCQKLCFAALGGGGGVRLACGTQSGLLQVLALPAAASAVGVAPALLEHCFRFNDDTARAGSGQCDDSDDEQDQGSSSSSSSSGGGGAGSSGGEKGWGVYGAAGGSLPFAALAVSPDGQWLAAAGRCNALAVYSLDRNALFWQPPRPSARITSLAFHPSCGGSGLLAAACVDNRFHLFEVEARRLADW